MALKLIWHGHGTWSLHTEDHKILIDPFFSGNPAADVSADEVEADTILLTHGHGDHVGAKGDGTYDIVDIAKRTKAHVVTIYETANWLSAHGVEEVTGMNLGGTLKLPFGSVKMTLALHSNGLPDGTYGGMPTGFVVEAAGRKIYFAGDTALFSDMKLIGDIVLDAAVLPIGDLFTMGIEDSIRAVKLLQPKHVVPGHFNTWPPIEQDATAWASKVRHETNATPHVLTPGQTFDLH
ncbi:metal-dependent hydrolase [Bremerella sp. T1]|uniref:metal-dependent hydrolase n=1 Tax=Bremerella sp. TYQ1 TaxID=3119568 RepID=UPI001CC910B4|nr:metal-dependent hydrolase [Bremerella volcania]UBM38488.1 metal-dependent hydrolase [Bremerella volcania]